MEIMVLREDVSVRQKMDFGTSFVSDTADTHGRNFHALYRFE